MAQEKKTFGTMGEYRDELQRRLSKCKTLEEKMAVRNAFDEEFPEWVQYLEDKHFEQELIRTGQICG